MNEVTEPRFQTAALVTIDTQRDTLDGEPLEISGTSRAVPNIARLCEGFRQADQPIVHIVRLYSADGSNAEPVRRDLVRGSTPVLRPGTPGRLLAPGLAPDIETELDDELLLAGGVQALGATEVVMYKPRWGAFYRTRLDDHLRAAGVDTVVFSGCNYPNCPRTSLYEASERDYRVALVSDAVSGLYDRAETELANIGVALVTTSEVLSALGSPTEASRSTA